jgi:hypothetical protein
MSRTSLTRQSHLGWFLMLILFATPLLAQEHSVARLWNDALLDAIRIDFARPTVHARNLFHTSIALYDAWVAYGVGREQTFLLGRSVEGFSCGFDGVDPVADVSFAREETMSYAAYRLLQHRFASSPGWETTSIHLDALFDSLGYDRNLVERSNPGASPARLGNHLANCLIEFGLQDGANEANGYVSAVYRPVNEPLTPDLVDIPQLVDPNRWQPLTLDAFIDQGGNLLDSNTPNFLGPEWGRVVPFSLREQDRRVFERDGTEWLVYHDPGPPPMVESDFYKWNFAVVAAWSSHLHPDDGVMIDISPASIGNIPVEALPETPAEYADFYDTQNGGDASRGRMLNPHTGRPYEPQIVPRADYARVLAEFWADGPDSETPPGHWFTILNYVNDHPEFTRRFRGTGPVMDTLEWDVKAYLVLGGAMHDAAVTAWGIKGWYDYIRPISALRYMASLGQSSDPGDLSYHPDGIPLIPEFIELVRAGDRLAGFTGGNVGRIKFRAWRGPRAISDARSDEAKVDWILAQSWWPYQRPNFVTPPFAGYVSGHSTFSRAAAEVMTLLTGDEYFPGGMGEFHAPRDEFLVFEDGPSVGITLQWATYRDASDQTSLSRIWGGIHPPVDDIPGRLIGISVGIDAFERAEQMFRGSVATAVVGRYEKDATAAVAAVSAWPNPVRRNTALTVDLGTMVSGEIGLYNVLGQRVRYRTLRDRRILRFSTGDLASGLYLIRMDGVAGTPVQTRRILLVE